MNSENNDYYDKILKSKDKEIADLTSVNHRLHVKNHSAEKLAETRYIIVQALRNEITSVQTWNKVLFLLSVVFLAFIIVMFKYYSDQRKEIEIWKNQAGQECFVDSTGYAIEYRHDTLVVGLKIDTAWLPAPEYLKLKH